MPKTRQPRTPKLRRHKTRKNDRAFVELDGKRFYLGPWNSPESQEGYDRAVAEWLANGRSLPVAPEDLTIVELCTRYVRHATKHYRDADGKPTSELDNLKRAIKRLRELYGRTRVQDFGPLQLKAIRTTFVEANYSRGTANRYTNMIRRVFKWGVSEGIVPFEVLGALQAVEGLKRGRSDARETEPIGPVPDDDIEAVKPHVSRQVRALIEIQLLTGARPGELLKLRAVDFDTSKDIWTATLKRHKTAYKGRGRVLYFGPKAQDILRELIHERPIHKPLFSPQDAEAERYAECQIHRRPNQNSDPRKTDRALGETYTTESYRRAIARACTKANQGRDKESKVRAWSPNQLRHNAATAIRREYGLETAQVILGHSAANTTEIYAEVDRGKALAAIAHFG